MNKELTPLDELKQLEQTKEEIKKLPKEMQSLLIIQKYLFPNYNQEAWLILCNTIVNYDKEHKALEIIKEKQLDMYQIMDIIEIPSKFAKFAVEMYNKDKDIMFQITIKEFNLLKDVLL